MSQLELFPERFSCNPTRYVTPTQREVAINGRYEMPLTAWNVQNLIFEFAQDHLLRNPPKSLGFVIDQTYSLDPSESQILLGIGHDWQDRKVGSCPAFFVFRDDIQYNAPTMGQNSGVNDVAESEKKKLYFRGMSCSMACIGKTVGFCEQLAEYMKIPYVSYAEVIQRDFKLRKFRVTGVGKPQQYRATPGVNNFIIIINMQVWFDEGFVLKRDDLKIKTITREIFDGCLARTPIQLQ